MEPMALGSPTSGSPAANSSYLPAFLMGNDVIPTTPRNNTLSPEKPRRNISFAATSPGFGNTTPQQCAEFSNHSLLGQRAPFTGNNNASYIFQGTPLQANHLNNTVNTSGPPTQDLFDSLRNDRNLVQTPTRGLGNNASILQSPQTFSNLSMQNQHNSSVLGMNAANAGNKATPIFQQTEGYLSNPASRITSPINGFGVAPGSIGANDGISTPNTIHVMQQSFGGNQSFSNFNNFWVTIFGFPLNASSNVLYHFAQCGTIVDKVFPSQNGNWVHIKYSSRLECDRALNYNEKIIMNNIMIGVTQCKEQSILDKENMPSENMGLPQTPKLRSLANTSYLAAQSDISVTNNRPAAKNNSILHKAVDLLFG